MLDFVEKALHQMTLSIQPSIVSKRLLGALVRRNNRRRAKLKNKVTERLSGITWVSNNVLTGQTIQQTASRL
jgi:hypothetical protein